MHAGNQRIALVIAGALALVVGATGVARPGLSASTMSGTESLGQRRLAELRERLSPELVRELDEVGRFVSLERLASTGALDALERPAQTDASDTRVEETFAKGHSSVEDLVPPTSQFDIDLFEQNIRDALDGETVGYAYSIWKAGDLYSEAGVGKARVEPDAPVTNQSATKTMTVASISKTVTAVAVPRLLQQKGISVDEKIGPWLPAAWEPGAGVKEITFRELMTHTSGLLQNFQAATGTDGGVSTGSWDNIKIAIEQDLGSQAYRYANMNFSIFRIMLPKIAYGLDWSHFYHKPPPGVTSAHYDTLTGIIFEDYVQGVMAPADVAVNCSSVDANPTRLYAYPTNGAAGWGPVSCITSCGGFGYYMSANAIASFLSHLRYTSVLVSPATRALMYEGELGINEYFGDHGTYLGHGAVWAKSGGKGMRGCAMSFHIQVDVALLVNSRGDYGHACNVVEDAFDAAWP